jgi:hypothetical protein
VPASSPEARENQLIALAEARAEEQLRNGTASSQVICHYLRLGSMREKLEREKLKSEVEMLTAKKEALESAKRVEELYSEAMRAVRSYRGESEDDE